MAHLGVLRQPLVLATFPHPLSPSWAGSGTASEELSWIPLSKVTCFLLGIMADPGTHLDYSTNHRLLQLSIHVSLSFLDTGGQGLRNLAECLVKYVQSTFL